MTTIGLILLACGCCIFLGAILQRAKMLHDFHEAQLRGELIVRPRTGR